MTFMFFVRPLAAKGRKLGTGPSPRSFSNPRSSRSTGTRRSAFGEAPTTTKRAGRRPIGSTSERSSRYGARWLVTRVRWRPLGGDVPNLRDDGRVADHHVRRRLIGQPLGQLAHLPQATTGRRVRAAGPRPGPRPGSAVAPAGAAGRCDRP